MSGGVNGPELYASISSSFYPFSRIANEPDGCVEGHHSAEFLDGFGGEKIEGEIEMRDESVVFEEAEKLFAQNVFQVIVAQVQVLHDRVPLKPVHSRLKLMKLSRSFCTHKPLSHELRSERASERMSAAERSGARKQSEQCGASE